MQNKTTSELFGNPFYNTVASILADAAGVDAKNLGAGDANSKTAFYYYLENCPFAALVIDIGEAIIKRSDELNDQMKNC